MIIIIYSGVAFIDKLAIIITATVIIAVIPLVITDIYTDMNTRIIVYINE